jgi:type IX secretion system PorP/SprF family membrane protein
MKKLIGFVILFITLLITKGLFAQQDAHFSQYMFNQQYINPAFAGTQSNITAMLFHRRQWVDMPGSPITQNLSAIVPFKRKNFAAGLNVVNDQIGITGSLNLKASFAYYLNLKKGRLSFGLAGGLQQYSLDGTKLAINDNTDQVFTNSSVARISPDFDFGIFYRTGKYFIGVASTHLNNPGRRVTAYRTSQSAMTARHYYISAGYTIEVDEKFKVIPTVLTRYSESREFSNNFSSDISTRVEYMELAWVGTAYRASDALIFFLGLNVGRINPDIFKENIKIGYAYDASVSRIPAYNRGSHEIFISYEYTPKVKRMMPKFK